MIYTSAIYNLGLIVILVQESHGLKNKMLSLEIENLKVLKIKKEHIIIFLVIINVAVNV